MDAQDWVTWVEAASLERGRGHLTWLFTLSRDGRLPEAVLQVERQASAPAALGRFPAEALVLGQPWHPLGPVLAQTWREQVSPPEGVYSLHRPLWEAWSRGQSPARRDFILPYEVTEEQQRAEEGALALLLARYGRQPLTLVLEQTQNWPASTWSLLGRLGREASDRPWLVWLVGHAPPVASLPAPDGPGSSWRRRWEAEAWSLDPAGPADLSGGWSGRNGPRLALGDPGQALEAWQTLLEFWNLPEARESARRLTDLARHHPDLFSPEETLGLWNLAARTAWVSQEAEALVAAGTALLGVSALRGRLWLAWAFGLRDRWEDLRGAAAELEAETAALGPAGDAWRLEALFLGLWADQRLRQEPFEAVKVRYRAFIALSQELEAENPMAFWLVNPYHLDRLAYLSEASYYIDWGIQLCQKLDNRYRLSEAYLYQAFFWSLRNDWDKVLDAYQASETLKARSGRPEDLSGVYNSRGYFLLQIGRFDEARTSFLRALDGLKERRDFKELGLTLFNLGIVEFRRGRWAAAEPVFAVLEDLLETLGWTSLVFHSAREVLILQALCQVRLGRFNALWALWRRIRLLPRQSRQLDEELLETLLELDLQSLEASGPGLEALQDQLTRLLEAERKGLKFSIPYAWLHLAEAWERAGRPEEARRAAKTGLLEAHQLPNPVIRGALEALLEGQAERWPQTAGTSVSDTWSWVLPLARQERALEEVRRRSEALEWLDRVHELAWAAARPADLGRELWPLLQGQFWVSGLVWLGKNGPETVVLTAVELDPALQRRLDEDGPEGLWFGGPDGLGLGLETQGWVPVPGPQQGAAATQVWLRPGAGLPWSAVDGSLLRRGLDIFSRAWFRLVEGTCEEGS